MTHKLKWGKWVLDRKLYCLDYYKDNTTFYYYNIPLLNIYNGCNIMFWIEQITMKKWADNDCIADLVRAFHYLFRAQDYMMNQRIKDPKTHIENMIYLHSMADNLADHWEKQNNES